MADVRINGKRMPPLQNIDNLETLIHRLESFADKNNSFLTSLSINNSKIDIDIKHHEHIQLEQNDTIDVQLDTPEHLSFESLQVALDMGDLLIQDLKETTLKLWQNNLDYEKSLHVLLEDCTLFLSLAARPIYLLNQEPENLDIESQNCLRELDKIAHNLENATLLAVKNYHKDACFILVGIVKDSIERWIGLSALFAQSLHINNVPAPALSD